MLIDKHLFEIKSNWIKLSVGESSKPLQMISKFVFNFSILSIENRAWDELIQILQKGLWALRQDFTLIGSAPRHLLPVIEFLNFQTDQKGLQ